MRSIRLLLFAVLVSSGAFAQQSPVSNNFYPFLKRRIDSALANGTQQKSIAPKDLRDITTRLAAAIQYTKDTRSAINVRDFGAIPDDGIDDRAAIQAAADSANRVNKSLYAPMGGYDLISGGVTVTINNARIMADGARWNYPLAGSALRLVNCYNLNVHGITFIGTNKQGKGVEVVTSSGVSISSCGFIGLSRGVFSETSGNMTIPGPTTIYNDFFDQCIRGVSMESYAEYSDITSNRIYGCTEYAVYVTAGNVRTIGNTVGDCDQGIVYQGFDGSAGNSDHSLIANNTVNHCWRRGIGADNLSYSMAISDNIVYATIGRNGNNSGFDGYDQTFGYMFRNCKNISLSGGTVAHNRCNIGIDGWIASSITGVAFKTDPTRTQSNYREFGANKSGVNLNTAITLGPNTFEGLCTGGRAATYDVLTDGRSQNYKIIGNSSSVTPGFVVLSGGAPGGYNFTGEQSLTIRSDYTGAVEINPVLFQNPFSLTYDQVTNDGAAYWILARTATVTTSTPYASVSGVSGGTSVKLSGEATYTFTPTGYSSWNITATAQPQPVRLPVLQNSYTIYSATASQPGYWKDGEGFVHLAGMVAKSGSAGQPIFTLPVGFRPARNVFQRGIATGSPCVFLILPDGTVQTNGTVSDASWLSFDGIAFRTDN